MKSKFVLLAAVFVSGLAAGVGGMMWQYNRDWNQWVMDFNLYPVLSEVTYGLKELRGGNAARLEATLDETVWRNIGLLSKQLEDGKVMPTHAEATLRYHCEHNQRHSGSHIESVVAERAQQCSRLLFYYAHRG